MPSISFAPMSGPRLRHDLDAIPAYKAGQPARVIPGVSPHKLSSNEIPFPPLPSVLAAAEHALGDMHRYPDFSSSTLVRALAERFSVPASDIAVATGSVGLAHQVVQIAAGAGDSVMFGWRSFESYPIVTQIAGATRQAIDLDAADRYDLDAMLAAINDTTRVIFVCNPNNPTGTAVDRDALDRFVNAVPSDILVIIDEAYREFVDPDRIPDGLDYYRQYENIAVLRTFSKAYGLAALRVGFCIAHEPVAEALRKVQVPFGVSSVAEAASVAALEVEDELLARVRHIVAERERVLAGLRAMGLHPSESEANFVWLRLGERTMDFATACEDSGLAVRPFPGEGVRISIGLEEANDRFLDVAQRWSA